MSVEHGFGDKIKQYLEKEWPGLYNLFYGAVAQTSFESVEEVSDLEKEMRKVEAQRTEALKGEMLETYDEWYEKFNLVRTNFRDLQKWAAKFEKNVPNWFIPDYVSHNGAFESISGLGYKFDAAIKSTHGQKIRLIFPYGGYGGLGDERRMGLYNLIPGGPTKNPYQLFNNTGDTPDLREMRAGAKGLLDHFEESNILISASDGNKTALIKASSSDLVLLLERTTLVDVMEKLIVAVNKGDLDKYGSSSKSRPLLLLENSIL